MNGRLPIRSHDHTSTFLHELVHVWQPFRPAGDGRWISEGIAEYYSLLIQRRAGLLSAAGFARGIELFARHGRWDLDLSRTHEAAGAQQQRPARPLLARRRDRPRHRGPEVAGRDVVRGLAAEGGDLTTASFLRAINRTAGKDFTPQFRRYVFRGKRPPIADEPLAATPGLPGRPSVRYRPQAPDHRPCPQCPA